MIEEVKNKRVTRTKNINNYLLLRLFHLLTRSGNII